jgi:hypothetical protein
MCGKQLWSDELMIQHLQGIHQMKNRKQCDEEAEKGHVHRNNQVRFWCGFCEKIIDIPVDKKGKEAWAWRFSHIDDMHFKKEQERDTWIDDYEHKSKGQLLEDKKRERAEKEANALASAQRSASVGRIRSDLVNSENNASKNSVPDGVFIVPADRPKRKREEDDTEQSDEPAAQRFRRFYESQAENNIDPSLLSSHEALPILVSSERDRSGTWMWKCVSKLNLLPHCD